MGKGIHLTFYYQVKNQLKIKKKEPHSITEFCFFPTKIHEHIQDENREKKVACSVFLQVCNKETCSLNT